MLADWRSSAVSENENRKNEANTIEEVIFRLIGEKREFYTKQNSAFGTRNSASGCNSKPAWPCTRTPQARALVAQHCFANAELLRTDLKKPVGWVPTGGENTSIGE